MRTAGCDSTARSPGLTLRNAGRTPDAVSQDRRLRASVLVAQLFSSLAACNGGSGSSPRSQVFRNANPITLSGSIGDGPVTGAAVTVHDANDESVVAGVSDATAGYQITVPAGTAFPITVTASGGTDLVTGLPRISTSNRCFSIRRSRGSMSRRSALWRSRPMRRHVTADGRRTHGTLDAHISMGMDGARVPDPAHGAIDATNIADVVLANEALGETLRRTRPRWPEPVPQRT